MQTINNYQELLKAIESNDVCLIKIGTTWCGPCKLTQSNMEELEKTNPDVCFINVDADSSDDAIIEHFHVMSVPVTIVTKNGEVVSREIGLQTVHQLKERINQKS